MRSSAEHEAGAGAADRRPSSIEDGDATHARRGARRGHRPARAGRDPDPAHRRRCADMPARSAFPAAGSIPATTARSPRRCARRRRRSRFPSRGRGDRHRRPLPHHHRLRGDPGGRRRAARSAARPHRRRGRRRVRGRRSPSCSTGQSGRSRRVEWQGRERHYYEIDWGERRIWGATAAMIVNLSRRLQWTA